MLDVRKLLMLRSIVDEGSIAGAARSLKYTRSAVSQQLKAFERTAGVPLVNRGGNRITLTPAGQALVEHTERILVELRAAEATLLSDTVEVSGLLRVGVPFRSGPRIMIRALTQVRTEFPSMEVRLVATTDDIGGDEVRRERLDMVIVSRFGAAHPKTAPGLREWILSSDPLRACVPVGHPLADAETCTLAQLRDERWIVCPSTMLGRLTVNLCITAGFEPTLAATVNDVGTAIDLVGAGWGVTIAPEMTPVGPEVPVVRIPVAGVDTLRYSILIVRDGDHLSPHMRTAISAVRAAGKRLMTPVDAR
jgi:DNA-binding transcriptional LysR family regulator